jgi:hypothetical protein
MRTIVKVFLFNQKSIDLKGKKELTKYMSKIRTKKKKKGHTYMYCYYYHLLLRLCSFKMNELVDKMTKLMDRLMQSK